MTVMEKCNNKTTTESTISKTWELSASVTHMALTDFFNAIANILTEMSWCLTRIWRLNVKIHTYIYKNNQKYIWALSSYKWKYFRHYMLKTFPFCVWVKSQSGRNNPEKLCISREELKKCKLGQVTTEFLFLIQ